MGVVEDETSPETLNFRASQLEKWAWIGDKREDYLADALKYAPDAGKAVEAANAHVRGATRAFVFDTLSRVPAGELPDFLRKFPRSWTDNTEVLLGEGVVPSMIARSFPKRQQAEQLDDLSVEVAADNAKWSKALGDFADATGTALQEAGQTAADVARTVAWTPVVLAAGVGLAAIAMGVTYVYKRF